ncbi:MAG TPA: methyltransferase domain-containing protein [Chloroflexota bacterium]|nr:methyltransferase domain-containing protein [Chloroflexota bacterium]
MLSKVRKRLEGGVDVPWSRVQIQVLARRRATTTPTASQSVTLRHIGRLLELFPELRPFCHDSIQDHPKYAARLLAFMEDYLPLFHEPARETQLRRLLFDLRQTIANPGFQRQLDREIAQSNLRSGVANRALSLKHSAELRAELEEFEKRYESKSPIFSDAWDGLTGDVRGRSLRAYFAEHEQLVAGKNVLHIAPEPVLRQWFQENCARLAADYTTLDAFDNSSDLRQDVTMLELPDGSLDVTICHRVLEHVLDDAAALQEIFRVLKRGGILNVSVPQSMNQAAANEWVIRDHSHDGHVRQYGRDFEGRLAAAGFDVQVERFLLERSLTTHLAEGTYPLRMYSCVKPAA